MDVMEKELRDLFKTLINDYQKMLADGSATPADRVNIRNILRDNGITFDSTAPENPISDLVDSLPDLPDSNVINIK